MLDSQHDLEIDLPVAMLIPMILADRLIQIGKIRPSFALRNRTFYIREHDNLFDQKEGPVVVGALEKGSYSFYSRGIQKTIVPYRRSGPVGVQSMASQPFYRCRTHRIRWDGVEPPTHSQPFDTQSLYGFDPFRISSGDVHGINRDSRHPESPKNDCAV